MTTSAKSPSTSVAPAASVTVSVHESPAAMVVPYSRPAGTGNVRETTGAPRAFAQA